MKNPIKLGIIGLGRAGYSMHLPEMKDKGLFDIYAVCDVEPDRLEKMKSEYGAKTYTRVEDIVRDPEIEVIDIATRSSDHFAHAISALNAGKTVFLEKPIAENYEQAKRLFEYAERGGEKKLYVRHNRRFEAKFMQVNEIINSGILGEIYYVKRATSSYDIRCDWQTLCQYGGGQLLNWGPHLIDQALQFAGGDYKRLNSYTRHVAALGDCEDVVFASFEGVNGRIVEIEISGAAAISQPEYIVYGSKGALVDKGETFLLKYIPAGFEYEIKESDPGTPVGAVFGKKPPIPFTEEERTWDKNKLDHVWQYLYDTVRLGKEYPIKSEEALKVMQVISEIKKQNGDF